MIKASGWHARSMFLAACLFTCVGQSANPGLREIIANPPGEMIEVGSIHIHLYCLGEGSPAVILDAGLGGFSMDWYAVQNNLSKSVKVCAYDRAGYGWSEPGPSPRVTDQLVAELEELLQHAHLQPPYVMVGHSFGGYNVQYFAKLNPKKVAGIALIESSHPDQSNQIPEIPAHRERSQASERLTTTFDASALKNYPVELQYTAGKILTSLNSIMTQRREFLYFNQSGFQVSQGGKLPDVPLLVMTRGQRVWPDDPYGNNLEHTWLKLQRDFLNLTSDTWQVIAKESGHQIHLQQPELVADSIRYLLRKICQRQFRNVNESPEPALSYCVTL